MGEACKGVGCQGVAYQRLLAPTHSQSERHIGKSRSPLVGAYAVQVWHAGSIENAGARRGGCGGYANSVHKSLSFKQIGEAVAGGLLPLAHYLQHVDDPEVNPNPYFDKAWYLRQYPEIARNGLDPVLHYWIFGVQERRDPGPWFSTDWYLWRYADVAALAMNPLVHYLRIGVAQGREAGPYFDSAWYLRQCPDRSSRKSVV